MACWGSLTRTVSHKTTSPNEAMTRWVSRGRRQGQRWCSDQVKIPLQKNLPTKGVSVCVFTWSFFVFFFFDFHKRELMSSSIMVLLHRPSHQPDVETGRCLRRDTFPTGKTVAPPKSTAMNMILYFESPSRAQIMVCQLRRFTKNPFLGPTVGWDRGGPLVQRQIRTQKPTKIGQQIGRGPGTVCVSGWRSRCRPVVQRPPLVKIGERRREKGERKEIDEERGREVTIA